MSLPGGPHTPAAVNESTAASVVVREGTQHSFGANEALTASWLCVANNSGIFPATRASGFWTQGVGVALFDAVSGERTTVARGRMRIFHDGVATATVGVPFGPSSTRSGWAEVSTIGSGEFVWGHYLQSILAAQSGTRVLAEVY